MRRIKTYLKRIYRLSLSPAKREAIVWKDLKEYLNSNDLKYGVFEQEKYIEIGFDLGDGKVGRFLYFVRNSDFECFARVLEDFPVELTSDIFILATHFNNILDYGTVTVNTGRQSVDYTFNHNILLPYLYPGYLHAQTRKHLDNFRDLLYPAFQRLIHEQEAPAIIIADLLKDIEAKSQK